MGRFTLVNKKERWGATGLGQLMKLLILIAVVWIYAWTIVPFLAPRDPLDTNILIVEGFIPDYALKDALQIFKDGNYKQMIITGKKRLKGAPLDRYVNDGEYSAATLDSMGCDMSRVWVVGVNSDFRKDRTYQSAVAVRKWMAENHWHADKVNLVSLGCHSRRSRLMFEEALGNSTQVGIIAIQNQSYDPVHWWRNSHGFREVTKETIAWIYARFFFFP